MGDERREGERERGNGARRESSLERGARHLMDDDMTISHFRVAHNELEKTRRANLRSCLERLKELVPSVSDNAARNTTLALLTRGRDHLKVIVDLRGWYR